MNIRKAEISSSIAEREPFVIETEHVEQRCLQIVRVHEVLDDVEAEVVGSAVRHAGPDAAAG